jgi:glutamate decarboxylase
VIFGGARDAGIPAISWAIRDGVGPGYSLYDLADRLRIRGWQVPAYALPADCQDRSIQRILVRHGVSRDLAAILLEDIRQAIAHFERHPVAEPLTPAEASGFHH